MIKYQLICDQNHEFEGWFQCSAAYDEQAAKGLLRCPLCDSDRVKGVNDAEPLVPSGENQVPRRPLMNCQPMNTLQRLRPHPRLLGLAISRMVVPRRRAR